MVEEKTVVRDQSPHPTGELSTLVAAGNADNTHTVTTKNRMFFRSDFGQISPSIPGLEGPQGLPISALCPRNAYTDYLHRSFKWFEEVQRGGYEYDPDVGKTRVRMEHLCRHWLSDMFGFYNFNEMVVQVNPH